MSIKTIFLFLSVTISFQVECQKDTCVITESAEHFLDSSYAWFLLNMDIGCLLGKCDTTFYYGDKEITINDPKKREWIGRFIVARDSGGDYAVIKVVSSKGQALMIYGLMSEGRMGNYYEYYPNGKLKVRGQYCEMCPDVKYGTWYYYSETGELKKEKKIGTRRCNHGEICK